MTHAQEAELLKRLEEAVAAMQQLSEVLRREQDALVHHRIEDLENAVEHKEMCLSQMQRVEQALHKSFSSMGFDDKRSLLDQIELLAHENLQLKTCAQFMRNTLDECRRLTQENASLVSSGLKRVNQSLDFLRKLHNDDPVSVYGPPGQKMANKLKRSITIV